MAMTPFEVRLRVLELAIQVSQSKNTVSNSSFSINEDEVLSIARKFNEFIETTPKKDKGNILTG